MVQSLAGTECSVHSGLACKPRTSPLTFEDVGFLGYWPRTEARLNAQEMTLGLLHWKCPLRCHRYNPRIKPPRSKRPPVPTVAEKIRFHPGSSESLL